jgi:hypothetical protein
MVVDEVIDCSENTKKPVNKQTRPLAVNKFLVCISIVLISTPFSVNCAITSSIGIEMTSRQRFIPNGVCPPSIRRIMAFSQTDNRLTDSVLITASMKPYLSPDAALRDAAQPPITIRERPANLSRDIVFP